MDGREKMPFWYKYTLSIEEAAEYFRIGEAKIRKIVNENPHADFVLKNGVRIQIKRVQFERFIDNVDAI